MGEFIKWSLWAANEVQPYIVNIAKGPLKKAPDPPTVTTCKSPRSFLCQHLADGRA